MANTVSATLASIPADRRAGWRIHHVAPDETLAAIGKRYGVTPASLMAANNLASAQPAAGDLLMIPTAARPAQSSESHPAVRKSAAQRAARPAATTARRPRTAPAKTSAASKPAHKPATILASAAAH
jgi:LysM repeat protein